MAREVFLGDPSRFANSNKVASYIGMIPCEHTSGKRQRLGKLTKEGNSLLRYLWTEATIHAVRKDPELKSVENLAKREGFYAALISKAEILAEVNFKVL